MSSNDEYLLLSGRSPKKGTESGSLFRYGDRLYRNSDNSIFDYRGTSMFLVPTRFFRGEDVQPRIDWMNKYGFNVARFFVAGVNWTGWSEQIYNDPNFQQRLGNLTEQFNRNGIRIEATVVTYQGDINTWRRVVSQVNEVLLTYKMNLLEIMNEPWSIWNNSIPRQLMPAAPSVVTALGVQPDSSNRCDTQDYMTVHLPRDKRYFRNTKDLYEMRVGSPDLAAHHIGIAGDEGIGVIDPANYPNYRQVYYPDGTTYWVDQYGRAARVTDTNRIATSCAIARLFSMGFTYHHQPGLEGRIPKDEPIVEDGARLIYEVFKFIPGSTQTGTYCRPGLGDFPVVFDTGDHPYASIVGNKAYLVMTLAPKGWVPTPVNGWKVEEIHKELNWLVRLVK